MSSTKHVAIDFGDMMLVRSYDPTCAYCKSKLAQVMDTIELA